MSNTALNSNPNVRVAYKEAQVATGYVKQHTLAAPAAASATNVLNAHAADGSTQAAALQPDFARTLQYKSSGTDTTHTVTVNGTDILDQALSETITLNGTSTVHGTHAFKTITGIVLPTVGANNISVGFDVAFGLGRCMTSPSVFLYMVGTTTLAADTAPTVTYSASVVSLNTVTPATAANASNNYEFWYCTTQLTSLA